MSMRFILLISAMTAVAIACIPMKNPDKGIRAGCDTSLFKPYDVPTCDAQFAAIPLTNKCSAATISPMAVACGPGLTIVLVGPKYTSAYPGDVATITCDKNTKKWIATDPANAGGATFTEADISNTFGFPAGVACGTGQWW